MLVTNRKIKNVFYKLHLYVGLTLGAVITLICLTGALVVYKPELEKLSIKELAFVTPMHQQLPLQTLLDNVRWEYPNHKIDNMVLYGGEDAAVSFRTTRPNVKGRVQVYVNPYTGRVLGADTYSAKLMQWLYDFHVNLLAGRIGLTCVAILGFVFLFILISGLLIAPTSNMFAWKKSASAKFILFKIHNVLGIFTAIFLMIIAFTGGYYGFKKEYQSLFSTLFNGESLAISPRIEPTQPIHWMSLDTILKTAQTAFPEGKPTMIFFPKSEDAVFSVRMKTVGDYERTGSNHVYIHPTTGHLVKTNLWKDKPTAEKMVRSMYFIHFGTFWGHFSRALWVLLGLCVPVLYFTGFYLWIKKLRK